MSDENNDPRIAESLEERLDHAATTRNLWAPRTHSWYISCSMSRSSFADGEISPDATRDS